MTPAISDTTRTSALTTTSTSRTIAPSPLVDAAQSPGIGIAQASSLPRVSLTSVASGVSQPTHVTNAGDGSDRLFVVERQGRVRIIQNGTLLPTPFLDISSIVGSSSGEQGLLSVAFPTGYASKGYFYVNYTDRSGDTVIARYRNANSPNTANPSSGEVLLTIDQPFTNHNGGQLAFGADGYLYIGMGDGGSAGDPQRNAQNPTSLLGKMLRIDVESGATTYAIPGSNPFVGTRDPNNQVRDEIWASGLRNPWRFSFDRLTGELYIADVGQSAYEEVNYQPVTSRGGENYGWNITEGSSRYNNNPGDLTGLVLPVGGYDHSQGSSITGGFVYRGPVISSYQGVYFYADFINGRIWGLQREGATWQSTLLLDTSYNISTFGEDEAGNLYVADFSNGGIYRFDIPATSSDRSLVWRNNATGNNTTWFLNNGNFVGFQPLLSVTDRNWQIVGTDDFNQDGKPDLLWRNVATGDNTIWLMNGGTPSASRPLPSVTDLNWQIVGVNDFNGDRNPDLLWRNAASGDNTIWLMNGTTATGSQALPRVVSSDWTIVGTADFNRDNQIDLFWRNALSGDNVIWFMNGVSPSTTSALPRLAGRNWNVAGLQDFDGDGVSDVLWRDSTTGENTVWLVNNGVATSSRSLPRVTDPQWTIAGITDFNNDNQGDLLWRNLTTGENLIWFMNGTTAIAIEFLPVLADPGWQVKEFA
jgi:glucose/arabinose dehydrogenase